MSVYFLCVCTLSACWYCIDAYMWVKVDTGIVACWLPYIFPPSAALNSHHVWTYVVLLSTKTSLRATKHQIWGSDRDPFISSVRLFDKALQDQICVYCKFAFVCVLRAALCSSAGQVRVSASCAFTTTTPICARVCKASQCVYVHTLCTSRALIK